MSKKQRITRLLYEIVIAISVTLFFALMAFIQGVGYSGTVEIKQLRPNWSQGYILVDARCDVTYHPFLYPMTWALRQGHFLNDTKTIYPMERTGGWVRSDIQNYILTSLILPEMERNLPILFIIVVAIELTKIRKLYVSFLTGIMGFAFAGLYGAIIGFAVGIFATFIIPKILVTSQGLKSKETGN